MISFCTEGPDETIARKSLQGSGARIGERSEPDRESKSLCRGDVDSEMHIICRVSDPDPHVFARSGPGSA